MRTFYIILFTISLLLIIPFTSCADKLIEETETYYETEYRTEERTETYTEIENIVINTDRGREYIRALVKWAGYNLFSGPDINLTRYYGYRIIPAPHQRLKIKITLSPGALDDNGVITVYDLTGIGQIPVIPTQIYPDHRKWSQNQLDWFHDYYLKLDQAHVLATGFTGNYSPVQPASRYIKFDAEGVFEFAIIADTLYYESVDMVQLDWEDDIVESREVVKERPVSISVPVQVEKQRTVQKIIQVPIWEIFPDN
jgi:hypothetical protein